MVFLYAVIDSIIKWHSASVRLSALCGSDKNSTNKARIIKLATHVPDDLREKPIVFHDHVSKVKVKLNGVILKT